MAIRVFISHQWRDKQVADRLARDLEPFATVWMDYRNLRPGDAIQATIDAALREMDLVLVVWTHHAASSDGVAAELDASARLERRIVPCFFEYDDDGRPTPSLPPALANVLGVDFHHYGSGIARVAELVVELQRLRLPAEAARSANPAIRLLTYLRGYLGYLANYRVTRKVDDDRRTWIDGILTEVERYLAEGGRRDAVRTLVEAARASQVQDPGIEMLIERLAPLCADTDPAQPGSIGRGAARAPIASADELERRVRDVVPAETAAVAVRSVDAYLEAAPFALQALDAYAAGAGSPAGIRVVQALRSYLEAPDDVIADDRGRYGRLDDAWLILNTAFRLIESGLVEAAAVPLRWPDIAAADHVVRAVLPHHALETLTGIMLQLLQIIASEVAAYQPWFTPDGGGYAPTMAGPRSAGGAWEDQMNAALLGTGLSVDG